MVFYVTLMTHMVQCDCAACVEGATRMEASTTPVLSEIARAAIDRRAHDRIAGPFDGFRVGALQTSLSIFD